MLGDFLLFLDLRLFKFSLSNKITFNTILISEYLAFVVKVSDCNAIVTSVNGNKKAKAQNSSWHAKSSRFSELNKFRARSSRIDTVPEAVMTISSRLSILFICFALKLAFGYIEMLLLEKRFLKSFNR